MFTTTMNLRSAYVIPMFLVLFAFPGFAQAQCGGVFGPTGWGGPTHIVIDMFGVSYGGFAGTEEWDPVTADMRYNSVDFLDPDNVFASLIKPLLLPVAHAQCGGTVPSVTPSASLTATPGVIDVGESTTLTWGSQNVSSCTGDAFSTQGDTSGTAAVSPTESTTYTISCYASGGSSGYTWQPYSTDVSDFACPLTDMTRGGYNHLEDCDVADPTGMSCTAGTQNCKTKVATASCTMETSVYSCEPPTAADATDTATVTVRPTGSCSVSPTAVGIGESVTWTAVASGGNGTYTYSWSGTDGLSGTNATVSKAYSSAGTKTASVTITSDSQSSEAIPCTVGGGTDDGGDVVTVSSTATTVTLTATPTSVVSGNSATLTWDSTGTSCTGTGFSTGGLADNTVGVSTGALTTDTNYSISCTGPGGTGTDTASVSVTNPDVELTAAADRVVDGGSTTLSWDGDQVSSCTLTGTNGLSYTGGTDASAVPSGAITTQTTFTVSCDSGVATDKAIVNVNVDIDEF